MDLLGNQRGKLRSMRGRCFTHPVWTRRETDVQEAVTPVTSWVRCRRSCSSQISFTRPMCQRRIPSAQWHQPRKCCWEHWKWEWLHSTKNGFLPLKDMESSYPKIAFQSSSRDLVELVFHMYARVGMVWTSGTPKATTFQIQLPIPARALEGNQGKIPSKIIKLRSKLWGEIWVGQKLQSLQVSKYQSLFVEPSRFWRCTSLLKRRCKVWAVVLESEVISGPICLRLQCHTFTMKAIV